MYKATCKQCDKFYIGNTQQHLKKRISQHIGEVKKLVNRGEGSDSFAKHFASHFTDSTNITRDDINRLIKIDVMWQGDPISCVKSFGKMSCSLCMKERVEILKASKKQPRQLINSRNEIYGACRHKTKFHRFTRNEKPSTDDGVNPERVLGHVGDFFNSNPNFAAGNLASMQVCPPAVVCV